LSAAQDQVSIRVSYTARVFHDYTAQ
jgi:hypothetical protein